MMSNSYIALKLYKKILCLRFPLTIWIIIIISLNVILMVLCAKKLQAVKITILFVLIINWCSVKG